MINTDSANIIYNRNGITQKEIKWYEESGHVITLDKEKDQLARRCLSVFRNTRLGRIINN